MSALRQVALEIINKVVGLQLMQLFLVLLQPILSHSIVLAIACDCIFELACLRDRHIILLLIIRHRVQTYFCMVNLGIRS